jgi:hypothetical protein
MHAQKGLNALHYFNLQNFIALELVQLVNQEQEML